MCVATQYFAETCGHPTLPPGFLPTPTIDSSGAITQSTCPYANSFRCIEEQGYRSVPGSCLGCLRTQKRNLLVRAADTWRWIKYGEHGGGERGWRAAREDDDDAHRMRKGEDFEAAQKDYRVCEAEAMKIMMDIARLESGGGLGGSGGKHEVVDAVAVRLEEELQELKRGEGG